MFARLKLYFYPMVCLLLISSVSSIQIWGQVNKLTKVCKTKEKYSFPTEDGFIENKFTNKKTKEYRVVFSDRGENVSYKDAYAQYPNKKVGFLDSFYVIDEKNGFLELVKYDPSLLPPRKGLLASILKKEKRYRFADIKGVEYIGWIHESRLLLNSKAYLSTQNMKPLRYILELGDPDCLVNRDKWIKGDTVVLYQEPDLANQMVVEATVPNLKDIVYIYKESEDKEKVLIGYTPNFNPDDLSSIYGWINKKCLLPIGQQQILIPATEDPNDENQFIRNYETFFDQQESAKDYESGFMPDSILALEQYLYNLNDTKFLFNGNLQNKYEKPSEQDVYSTYLPFEVWDHSPHKVINIDGQFVSYKEFKDLQKKSKKLNVLLLLEENPDFQTELLQLTNSLQKLYGILNKDELKGYTPVLGAICYNENSISKTLPFSRTFPKWLDFIQDVAQNSNTKAPTDSMRNGFELALEKAAEILNEKSAETNLLIIVGANASDYDEIQTVSLANTLADVSSRMLFYQLKNKGADSNLNFVFKAKSLLYDVGKKFTKSRQRYIVDSRFYKTGIAFTVDEAENIFMFNPESCMYQGGVAFPRMNSKLHPNTFDKIFEQLILQIATHNTEIEGSLQEFFDGIGRTRSRTHPSLLAKLNERSMLAAGLDSLPTSSYEDNFQIPFYGVGDSLGMVFEHYYLVSPQEHEACVNHLKKLVPDPPPVIDRKFRKRLYKSYKETYKELRKPFGTKTKARKQFLDNLMFMGTGMTVNDEIYSTVPLLFIKKQRKIPNEILRELLADVRNKIKIIEEYPIKNQGNVHPVKNIKYLYMPTKLIP